MESHSHTKNCDCAQATTAVQSLDEMEFERGIWSAALYNEIPRLEQAIARGQVNTCDNSGYTALHYAARSGHLEACRLLLIAGARVDAQTRSGGVTSLHRAVLMGHQNVVALLLQHHANPAICDADGQNAMHKAAVKGNIELVQMLLKVNAQLVSVADSKGRLPVDLAVDTDVVRLIKAT